MVENNIFFSIKKHLKGKIVIIGVGNSLRGDDGAGPEFIKSLEAGIKCSAKNIPSQDSFKVENQLVLMDVQGAPENYLGKIVEQKPDTVILVDAVDLGSSPGVTKIINQNNFLPEGFSTHHPSLDLILRYLQEETETSIFVLGIQPKSIKMNTKLSRPVKKAINQIKKSLLECMDMS